MYLRSTTVSITFHLDIFIDVPKMYIIYNRLLQRVSWVIGNIVIKR